MNNLLIILLSTVLLFHNVFALYAEVFLFSDPQIESACQKNGQPDELSFTEAKSGLINQFIFDSEFKNVNATISVFEEHRNLFSEVKSSLGQAPTLTLSELLAEISCKSILISSQLSFPNSFKLALQSNLYSFRF